MIQLRVATMIDRKTTCGIRGNGRAGLTQRIDCFVAGSKCESFRQHFAIDHCSKHPHTQIVRRGISRAGQTDLRQPKNRQRHTGLLRKKKDLLGCQLAPRVAEQSDRKHPLHAFEIRLHLVVDAAVLKFVCEGTEILGKHTHGRGVE